MPTDKSPPLRSSKNFIPPPEEWVNGCNTALTTTKPGEKGEDGDAANLDKSLQEKRLCHQKGTNARGHCKWTKIANHDEYTLKKMKDMKVKKVVNKKSNLWGRVDLTATQEATIAELHLAEELFRGEEVFRCDVVPGTPPAVVSAPRSSKKGKKADGKKRKKPSMRRPKATRSLTKTPEPSEGEKTGARS